MLEYLTPHNPVASPVVYALWLLFALWCVAVLSRSVTLRATDSLAQTVTGLVSELVSERRRIEQRRFTGEFAAETTAEAFDRIATERGLNGKHPVTQLAKRMFTAGVTDTRLEIRELLDNTANLLTNWDVALRNILSAFLVIGLLGTLFGLADSIIYLMRLMREKMEMAGVLAQLLDGLKGAFAPSISGVLATVAGTCIFTAYQTACARPVLGRIRHLVLSEWYPELCPGTGQKVNEAAERAVQYAVKVVNAAESIDKDSSRLRDNLASAAETSRSYADQISHAGAAVAIASRQLQSVLTALQSEVTALSDAAGRWSSFEGEISRFYQVSAQAQTSLVERHQALEAHIADQTGKLETVLGTIGTSVGHLHDPVARASQDLANTAGLLSNSVQDIRGHVSKTIEQAVTALQKTNADQADRVEQTFREFSLQLKSLNVPFRDAAREMQDSAQIILKRTASLMEGVNANSAMQVQTLQSIAQRLEQLHSNGGSSQPTQSDPGLMKKQEFLLTQLTEAVQALRAGAEAHGKSGPNSGVDARVLAAVAGVVRDELGSMRISGTPQRMSDGDAAQTRELINGIRDVTRVTAEFIELFKQNGIHLVAPPRYQALTAINSHT